MENEAAAGNGKSFEENMLRLETLVRQLERGELSLEDALASYQEGVALAALCQKSLERISGEVELLTESLK
jgi:exodeoxyribonuclease VII small subunit